MVPLNELLQYDCRSCNKIFRRNQLTTDLLFHGRYYEDALFFMKFFAKKNEKFSSSKKNITSITGTKFPLCQAR